MNLGSAHLWLFGAPLERGLHQAGLLATPKPPCSGAEGNAATARAEVVEGRNEARLYWEEVAALTGGNASAGGSAPPAGVACAHAAPTVAAVLTLESVEQAAAVAKPTRTAGDSGGGEAVSEASWADLQHASVLRASALASLGHLHLLAALTGPTAPGEGEGDAARSLAAAKEALTGALLALAPLSLDAPPASDLEIGGGGGGVAGAAAPRAQPPPPAWVSRSGRVVRGRALAALGAAEHTGGFALRAEGLLRAALADVAAEPMVTKASASAAAMAAWGDSWGAGGVGGAPATHVSFMFRGPRCTRVLG